ncbi:MAG: aminopeptidase [Anaerolineales bacterium]
MTDERVERLADILVSYSMEVQPGHYVALYGSHEADELLRALYRKVLQAGAYPYVFSGYDVYFSYGGYDDIFFREASEEQLQHVFRTDRMVLEEFDAMLSIRSQSNTRTLSGVDPARISVRSRAYSDLRKTYFDRGASGDLKWTVTMYPTNAYAQDAEMSRDEFADFVFGACYADRDDPVAVWRGIHERQQVLVDWLDKKKEIKVKGSNIDLSLSIDGRKFINSDGTANMPSGEIFTGPVEDSVEGWVRFSYPAVTRGVEVNGVELRFEKGKVVEAKAEKNEAFLKEMLAVDEGASYLGEWAIGTNDRIDRFIKNILFDEKIGGTIHMAIGAGYPETGSVNDSAIHWDMICDMGDDGQIYVDDELFYRGGKFLIEEE